MVGGKFRHAPNIHNYQQKANAALPQAANDTATVASGGTASVNVIGNDVTSEGTIDKGSVVITQQPAHGTVTVNSEWQVVESPTDEAEPPAAAPLPVPSISHDPAALAPITPAQEAVAVDEPPQVTYKIPVRRRE